MPTLWERREARWAGNGRTATQWPATPFAAFAAPTLPLPTSCPSVGVLLGPEMGPILGQAPRSLSENAAFIKQLHSCEKAIWAEML